MQHLPRTPQPPSSATPGRRHERGRVEEENPRSGGGIKRKVNPETIKVLNAPVVAPRMSSDGTTLFAAKEHVKLAAVNVFEKASRRYAHVLRSSKINQAVVAIQRWFRGVVRGRIASRLAARYEQIKLRVARLAWKWLRRTRRSMQLRLQQLEAEQRSNGDGSACAAVVQRWWRCVVSCRQFKHMRAAQDDALRNLKMRELREGAAVVIQATWRRCAARLHTSLARRCMKRCRDRRIVNTVRRFIHLKLAKNVRATVATGESAAAVTIQRWWLHQRQARMSLVELLSRKGMSAVK